MKENIQKKNKLKKQNKKKKLVDKNQVLEKIALKIERKYRLISLISFWLLSNSN